MRIYTQLQLRKWGSFVFIAFNTILPGLFLNYYFSIPLLTVIFGYSTIFLLSSFWLLFESKNFFANKSQDYRLLNLKNAKEKKIHQLVTNLAIKSKIAVPEIYVQLNHSKTPTLRAFVLGWPFPQELFISENLINVYLKGCTNASLEARLAHELCHLQNQDPAISFITDMFSKMLKILFLLSIFTISPLTIISIATLVVLNELSSAMLSRATEILADRGALQLMKKPSGVKRFIYDIYLQYLCWGQIVIQNKFASERWLMTSNQQLIKQLYRRLSHLNYKQTYDSLQLLDQEALIDGTVNSSILWRSSLAIYDSLTNMAEYGLTWFNTHPTIKERLNNLKLR